MEKRGDKMDINILPGRILTTENGLKSIRLNPNGIYNGVLELES